MGDPASAMSYTIKAGRLLSLLAWIALVSILVILGLGGVHPMMLGAALIGAASFVVAAGLRRQRPWARIAGVVVSAFSLAYFPIGTIIGAVSLYYLHKGWNEQPSVA